jgi:ribonuclease HI
MKKVTVVCDGSSIGNGTTEEDAAAAACLKYTDPGGGTHYRVVGEYLGRATNNQAEILAAAIGLEALKEPCEVELITDSEYVVKTCTGRFRKRANHELWLRLEHAASRHQVKWIWVPGHSGNPLQELCDKTAREIARRKCADPEILDWASAQAKSL